MIAAAVMAVLLVCLTFLLELLPADRNRLSVLGALTASSVLTISLGASFLFGGFRELDGHSLSGITLAGLAVVWGLIALVPFAVRRPHADLTDLLVRRSRSPARRSPPASWRAAPRSCARGQRSR